VDQVRDAVVGAGAAQGGEVGHVALEEADLAHLLVGQNEAEAARVFLEVVYPDLGAALEEVADDPGADAAVAAGEQDTHEGFPCLDSYPTNVS
jgi:hypothetical protein